MYSNHTDILIINGFPSNCSNVPMLDLVRFIGGEHSLIVNDARREGLIIRIP